MVKDSSRGGRSNRGNYGSEVTVEIKGNTSGSLLSKLYNKSVKGKSDPIVVGKKKVVNDFANSDLNVKEREARLKVLESYKESNDKDSLSDDIPGDGEEKSLESSDSSGFVRDDDTAIVLDDVETKIEEKESVDDDINLKETEDEKDNDLLLNDDVSDIANIIAKDVDEVIEKEGVEVLPEIIESKHRRKSHRDIDHNKKEAPVVSSVVYGFSMRDELEKSKSQEKKESTNNSKSFEKKITPVQKDDIKIISSGRDRNISGVEVDDAPSSFLSKKKTYFNIGAGRKSFDDDKSAVRGRKVIKKNRVKKPTIIQDFVAKEINLPDVITVQELANRMAVKSHQVVKSLVDMGVMATSSKSIEQDIAELVVLSFNHIPKKVSAFDLIDDVRLVNDNAIKDNDSKPRTPIVAVMGHVDHGKTSLLDAIRETDVTAKEFGGITQAIGASMVKTKAGDTITFLDTPGHEAFTNMRIRGANVTDIVVLVVSADDGIKDQTIEAINHAKAANVPIIVAINKIDKEGANPEKVKLQLLEHNLVLESMGGDVLSVEVSALKRTNIDLLEETILLQSEILGLVATHDCKAVGSIIETRVDKQRGVVVSLIVLNGVLRKGDILVAGDASGKVRLMSDDKGKSVKEAYPSQAVEVFGFNQVPDVGIRFDVVENDKIARDVSLLIANKKKDLAAAKGSRKSLDDMILEMNSQNVKIVNFIIKADVKGSVEAIVANIQKIEHDQVKVNIIHSAVGAISESDLMLAKLSDAAILGFNVKLDSKLQQHRDAPDILIQYYNIIYELLEDVKTILSGKLAPVLKEKYKGKAEVRMIFTTKKNVLIIGCFVRDGVVTRGDNIKIKRNSEVIYEGKLGNIKNVKEDAKQMKQGFECGMEIPGFLGVEVNDEIECFEIIEEKDTI